MVELDFGALLREPPAIEIRKGGMAKAVDETVKILKEDPTTFDFGSAIATVDNGTMHVLDRDSLAHHLGKRIRYCKQDGRTKELQPCDPPDPLVRQIIALGARRQLKPLVGVISAPTIRLDGSVLHQQGYDRATRLYVAGDLEPIPDAPTMTEVERALDTLLGPFQTFPFVDVTAKGAILSALLTAAVRPVLPTSPAFAFDAPSQGSGKTLLGKCVGALIEGTAPDIWPHTRGRDDEETRKRLFSALSGGRFALIWDNVIGVFDSASMAALITSEIMTDRVLGKSEAARFPNRTVVILTGNNIRLAGDMPRRVITCRIDPRTEHPFDRQFELDPFKHVLDNRPAMMVAACTLIRAQLNSPGQPAQGRLASFEDWDRLVRQTVVWLEKFGDPMDLIREAQSSDPEAEALFSFLTALRNRFGDRAFSARDLQPDIGGQSPIGEAIFDMAGEVKSTKSLGMILKNREGRIAGGLCLEGRKDTTKNTGVFRVIHRDGTTGNTGTVVPLRGEMSANDISAEAPEILPAVPAVPHAPPAPSLTQIPPMPTSSNERNS